MVSACFFHVGQHQLKLIGWEGIRNLDRLQRSDAARRRRRSDPDSGETAPPCGRIGYCGCNELGNEAGTYRCLIL